jgi:hypothetical protein
MNKRIKIIRISHTYPNAFPFPNPALPFHPCVKLPNKRLLNRIFNPILMFHQTLKTNACLIPFCNIPFPSIPILLSHAFPCYPISVPMSFFNFPNSLMPNAIPMPSQEKHIQEGKRTASHVDLETR